MLVGVANGSNTGLVAVLAVKQVARLNAKYRRSSLLILAQFIVFDIDGLIEQVLPHSWGIIFFGGFVKTQ